MSRARLDPASDLLISFFSVDEAEHARIRRILDEHASEFR